MKTVKRFALAIGIILVLFFLSALLSNIIFGHQFRKTLTGLQAEGRPTNIAEFRPAPIPEEQNAAPLFEKATLLLTNKPVPTAIQELSELMQELSESGYQSGVLGLRDLPEDRRERLIRIIEEPDNETLYAMLSEAAHKADYNSYLKYEEMTTASSGLSLLASRQLIGFLGLKAEVAAYRGHGHEAGEVLLDGFRLANLLKQEPDIIQLLVSIACDVIQMKNLYRITDGMDLPAHTLQSLEAELKDHMDATPYVRTMDEDRIIALKGYQALVDGNYRDVMTVVQEVRRLPPFYAWIYRTCGLLHRDMTVYLNLQAKIQDECRMPSNKIITSLHQNPIEKQIPAFCPLSRIMLPKLESILITKTEYEAWLQVTRIGLALKRYKIANSVYPDKLTSLVPVFLNKIPKDPCGGNSLLYRKEAEGFLLYSVGRDLQDNQGTPINLRFPSAPYDITWESMR